MIPSTIVTVWDAKFYSILNVDVSADLKGLQYGFDAGGCASAQFDTLLSYAQTYRRGYWRGRNGIEISTADDTLQAAISPTVGSIVVSGPASGNWSASTAAIAVTSGTAITIDLFVTAATDGAAGSLYVIDGTQGYGKQYVAVNFSNAPGQQHLAYTFTPQSSSIVVVLQANNGTWTTGSVAFSNVSLRGIGYLLNASTNLFTNVAVGSPVTNIKTNLGVSKLYVTSTAPYDPAQTLAGAQIALFDGAVKTALIQVTSVGTDAGGPFIMINPTPFTAPSNPTSVPSYGAGTLIYRRVWSGRVGRRTRYNQRADKRTTIVGVGIGKRLNEVISTYTFSGYDAGQAIYQVIQNAASRFTDLNVAAMVQTTIGSPYTGSNTNISVGAQITQILASIVPDIWALRVGHDRVPMLVRVYISAVNTYPYPKTLSQHAVRFVPMDVQQDDEDTSQQANAQLVYGDTDPATQQPVQSVVYDSTSITQYMQIDAAPTTVTGVKTAAAAAQVGTALLNQTSYPRSSTSFKLYVRNDNPLNGATAAASPIGLTDGDVIYGFEGISLAGFDEIGASANAAIDSEIQLANGLGSLWVPGNGGMSIAAGVTPSGGNAFLLATASSSSLHYEVGPMIPVAPGQVFTFTAYIDASQVTSGNPRWTVNQFGGPIITGVIQSVGTAGFVAPVVFVVPPGIYGLQIVADQNGAVGSNLLMSQPLLLRGTPKTVTYSPNFAQPAVYGIPSSVQTKVDAAGDRVQTITFAPVEPDINSAMREAGNAVAAAILANTQTPVSLEQYCVSTDARSYTYSATSLVLMMPTFGAIFTRNSSIVLVSATNVTLAPNATNFVWLNPGGGYTIKQNDPSKVAGAILIGYFTTSASGIIGDTFRASVGVPKVGYGNVNVASSFPAPVVAWQANSPSNGYSLNGLAADVNITANVTNVPTDGSVAQLLFLYRLSGQTPAAPYIPYGAVNLTSNQSSQVVAFAYGGLDNGAAYDFVVAFVGLAGYGAISNPYTNWTAKTIAIPTSYLLGGTAITPAVSNVNVASGISANGINSTVSATFDLGNQPTDGSLSRINVWLRATSAGGSNTIGNSGFAWNPYGGPPAVGVGTALPPASAAYNFTFTDLTNGTAYDIGVSYENAQGGESTIAVLASDFTAAAVNITPGQTSFANLLTSKVSGLTIDATGNLVMPYGFEIYPNQTPQSIGLASNAYSTLTSKMRFRLSNTAQHPGLVLFSDAAITSNNYNSGYMLQWTTGNSSNGTLAIYKRAGGTFTLLSSWSAPQTFTAGFGATILSVPGVPLQNTNWHELKFVAAPDPIPALGGIALSAYLDGTFYGVTVDRSNSKYTSGICGPANRDYTSPTLIDPADFTIVSGAGSFAENAAGASLPNTIMNGEQIVTRAAAGTLPDTSALVDGTVSRRHLTGAIGTQVGPGGNALFNPTAAINTTGWNVYANAGNATVSRDGYLGGRFTVIIGAGTNYAGSDALWQQTVNVLPSQQRVLSGYYECDAVASGGFVNVDIYGAQSNAVLASSPAAPATSTRVAFSVPYTTGSSDTSVYVRLRTNCGSTSPTSASVGYFYQLQDEIGTISTLNTDSVSAGLVSATHQPTPGVDGSYLTSSIVSPRHMQPFPTSTFLRTQQSIAPSSTSFQIYVQGYSDSNNNFRIYYGWPAWSVTFADGTTLNALAYPSNFNPSNVIGTGAYATTTGTGAAFAAGVYYVSCYASSYGGNPATFFSAGSLSQAQGAMLVHDGTLGLQFNVGPVTIPAAPAPPQGGGTATGSGSTYTPPPPTCPSVDQIIETHDGFVLAGDVRAGTILRGWGRDELNVVTRVSSAVAEMLAFTIAGEELRVDANHQWLTPAGWMRAYQLCVGDLVVAADRGEPYAIEAIRSLGEGRYAEITCERQRFRIGRAVAHNVATPAH